MYKIFLKSRLQHQTLTIVYRSVNNILVTSNEHKPYTLGIKFMVPKWSNNTKKYYSMGSKPLICSQCQITYYIIHAIVSS